LFIFKKLHGLISLLFLFTFLSLSYAGTTEEDYNNCSCPVGQYYEASYSQSIYIQQWGNLSSFKDGQSISHWCHTTFRLIDIRTVLPPCGEGTYHALYCEVQFERFDEICKVCVKEDTPFPKEQNQSEYSNSWVIDTTDNRQTCSENNGTIENAMFTCIKYQRCKTPKVSTCDDNQTLDSSVSPPICVDITPPCEQKDTKFPQITTNEQEILKHWTNIDANLSQTCLYMNGTVQSQHVSCQTEYRCVKQTDNLPKICPESISSYVSPRNGTFHEDIGIDGVGFGLHYDSSEWNSTSIAHGWSVSTHARLEGDRLHYGSGSVRVVDVSTLENGLTVVLSGSNEMLFDVEGKLQSIRDLYTKETKTTFSYDLVGNLVTLTNLYEKISTIERDASGQVTAIVAPTGQRTLLSIDSNGDLVEVQYEDTASYAFEYERHLMTVETEPNGNRFLHFFDDSGNVVKVIDAEQAEWNFDSTTADTYNSHTVTRASGDIITYKNHFLENNTTLRTEKLLPTGDIVEYTNSIDDSMSSTKSCGMTTTNLYKTNLDGSLFKDVYIGKRVLESSTVVTPSGLTNTTHFTKAYTLKQDGSLKRIVNTSTTNQKTSTAIVNYKRHRNISVSPLGKRSHVQYDTKMQNPLHIKAYGLHKTYYSYDTQGRVTQESTGNRVTHYTYNPRGNLQSITDPLGRVTTYTYDSRDRVIQTTYADGSAETYEYDANSNLVTRTVPTPTDHTFSYNGVNKRVSNTSPLQKQTTYTYDKQRRITKITKPSQKTIDTTYTNGRVTTVTTPEGTTNYSYACQSNVANISKNTESLDFTYDGTLLTSMTYSGQVNQAISYTYNSNFNPTSMTYANQTESYVYNDDGEIVSIGALANAPYTITRTKRNKLITLTDGTYTKTTKINRYGELRKVKDNIIKVKLFRNKAGQIKRKVEKLTNQRKKVYHYTYDDRGRLTEVKERRNVVESYTYDANGNRQSATVNGTTVTVSYTLDDNLIVYGQNTYTYDEDGYLQTKTTPNGTTTYTYGTLGELKEVITPTKTITYLQNVNNQRVAKLVDGVITEKYLWANLTTLLAVYDGADNLVQRFEYVDARMPVAMTDGYGTKYYLHYDQVGTLRAVSDTSHNIVKEITYDTFGNILSDSNKAFKIPFGFAGGLYDADTKLTRFGYRDYDATTGKWTAKDPIGFSGGDSNLYGYVLGDPVDLTDSTGLITDTLDNPIMLPLALGFGLGLALNEAMPFYSDWWNSPHWWDFPTDDEQDVFCESSQRGKKNLRNEYTKDVQDNKIKDPCKYLKSLYNSTKNSVERAKIRKAQKHFGCDGKNRYE